MTMEDQRNLQVESRILEDCLPFPWKVHALLRDVTKQNGGADESIVSWLPDGLGFKVHKPEAFVDDIMPRYFKQTKYKSFQRQVSCSHNAVLNNHVVLKIKTKTFTLKSKLRYWHSAYLNISLKNK